MWRLRARAPWLLFALVLVGFAASAGATLARAGCCGEMDAGAAPCASLLASSCCEERASGPAPGQGGPSLLSGAVIGPLLGPAPRLAALAVAALHAPPPALATPVLRL